MIEKISDLQPKIEHADGVVRGKHSPQCLICGNMTIIVSPASEPSFDENGWHHVKTLTCANKHSWTEKVRVK